MDILFDIIKNFADIKPGSRIILDANLSLFRWFKKSSCQNVH